MPTIGESVEIDVPVSTAYDQWTQFEEVPFEEFIETRGTETGVWRGEVETA